MKQSGIRDSREGQDLTNGTDPFGRHGGAHGPNSAGEAAEGPEATGDAGREAVRHASGVGAGAGAAVRAGVGAAVGAGAVAATEPVAARGPAPNSPACDRRDGVRISARSAGADPDGRARVRGARGVSAPNSLRSRSGARPEDADVPGRGATGVRAAVVADTTRTTCAAP